MIFEDVDEKKLSKIAKRFASLLFKGSILLLYGDLGSGKTTFTRYLVESLGGKPYQVSSPTFTIVNEYDARLKIYHIDLFRLSEEETEEFPFEEYFESDGISIVEWPERLAFFIPDEYFKLEFDFVSQSLRNLRIFAKGTKYEEALRGEFFAEI